MTHDPQASIPRFQASQFGAVYFEGEYIPCAFGGDPGHFTAFVVIEGVCRMIGISYETELARIKEHHLLNDGLFRVPFNTVSSAGKLETTEYPAITLTRLHTWLALIPPDSVPDGDMRHKLETVQKELTDVLYAYFGRPLLPEDMRAEDDRYLSDEKRAFYQQIEEAYHLTNRLDTLDENVGELRAQVDKLRIAVLSAEEGETIDKDQQEMLRAMIDILARQYQEKHGQGTYYEIEKGLKERYNWRYYKSVPNKVWAPMVRECAAIFRQLFPKGTKLPRVFDLALQSTDQAKLF